MITEQDLQEAIAECEGQRNPTANTCIKLAAFYTIRNELFGSSTEESTVIDAKRMTGYSGYDAHEDYESDSEFGTAIRGLDIVHDVLPLVDELLSALSVLNPKLYYNFLDKLAE